MKRTAFHISKWIESSV